MLNQLALGFGRPQPLVLQTEATECGLACLAMVARYHGDHIDLAAMRQRFPVSLKGATLAHLLRISQQLQLGCRPLKLELRDIDKLKLPCVLHWNFNHFVVLTAVNSYGLSVALFLTIASCATLGRQSSGTWEERVKQIGEQMKNLRLILYVGTFMLIVGVLLIRSVFQWALAFGPRETEAIKAVDTLFSALLAAEGGYFTLILAVVYLPAALILKHRVDSLAGEPAEPADKAKALERNNLTFSFTQSLPKIAAILGPLLAGPIGELLGRLG